MNTKEFIESIKYDDEIWKDIPGYESYYMCSNKGRVIACERPVNNPLCGIRMAKPRIMKPTISESGYYKLHLAVNGSRQTLLLHRIVAMTFIENPDQKPFVDHIDGNRLNCDVTNLKWVTHEENMKNCHYKPEQHKRIPYFNIPVVCFKDNQLVRIYSSSSQATKDGFDQTLVTRTCEGHHKHHRGYQFMYLEEYQKILVSKYPINFNNNQSR